MPQHLTSRRMDAPAEPARWTSDDLVFELQSTLQVLTDAELRYEVTGETLELWLRSNLCQNSSSRRA